MHTVLYTISGIPPSEIKAHVARATYLALSPLPSDATLLFMVSCLFSS